MFKKNLRTDDFILLNMKLHYTNILEQIYFVLLSVQYDSLVWHALILKE